MSTPASPAPAAALRAELRQELLRNEGWFRYSSAEEEFVVTITRGPEVRAARINVDLEAVLDWLMGGFAAMGADCFPEQSPLRATFSLASIHVEEDLDTGVDPFRYLGKH
jgi:hypothetical protein